MNGLGAHCVWLSGVRYCGRSAEAAVLPLIKLVSSEQCHASVSLPFSFLLFADSHTRFNDLSVLAGHLNLINDPQENVEITCPLPCAGQNSSLQSLHWFYS